MNESIIFHAKIIVLETWVRILCSRWNLSVLARTIRSISSSITIIRSYGIPPADLDDVLGNNRPIINGLRDTVTRGTDDITASLISLLIRFPPDKYRKLWRISIILFV